MDLRRHEGRHPPDRGSHGEAGAKVVTLVAFALTTIGVSGGVGWYIVSQDVLSPGEVVVHPGGVQASVSQSGPWRCFLWTTSPPREGQEYLAAGMHDEIIAKLSLLDGVRVVSRTTSMRYSDTRCSRRRRSAES